MKTDGRLLRGTWHIARGRFWRIRLYTDRIEIRTWQWGGGTVEHVPMDAIMRADIAPRGRQRTLLVLRFQNGTKRVLRVPGPGMWKQAINQMRAVPFFVLA